MAESAVSFVLERLGELIIEEAKFLHGVGGEVQQIHNELSWMQAFLKDADARQNEEERIRMWVADVRNIAYDAGDVLDSFLLGVEPKRRGGIKNILRRYVCILNEGVVLHNVGSEIKGIKTRISKLKSCLETYGIRSLNEGQDSSSTSAMERQSQLRRTYSHVGEEDFVGLEGDVEKLVDRLLVGEERDIYCRVVSICGMGGLGKTTLAKRIYNHPKVKNHFTSFAWVCISQRWQTKDILQQVLLNLIPDQRKQVMGLRDEELIKKLFKVQENKACLIVLDDIWSKDAWDCLKPAFPMGKTGSKLLLTSRKKEVATHVDPEGFLYLPRLLNKAECWELLKRKAFIKRIQRVGDQDVEKMEKLGSEMVKHCGGLPLAIIVLGGLLVTKKTLSDWKNVHHSIKSLLRSGEGVRQDDHGGIKWMLALSYTDLPYQLKPCFLYMGKFFEDSEIETTSLYQMWIAESMVKSKDQREGETLMNVADRYLGELAQRCMVQVIEEDYDTQFRRFKSCRLHDLMRDLCLDMAKEEDFFNLIDFRRENDHGRAEASSSSSNYKARRLVMYCDEEASGSGDVALTAESSKHLRSFLFFNKSIFCEPCFLTIVSSHIDDFKLLRVLAIERLNTMVPFEFPKGICNLIHLRYLSLRRTKLIMFPSSITNLEHLQTLDLRETFLSLLPCMATALRKMGRLQHLYLPAYMTRSSESLRWRLDGLVNLETLEIFDPNWCNTEDLLKLTNVRKIKAKVHEKLEEIEKIVGHLTSTNTNHFCHSSLSLIKSNLSTEDALTAIRQLLACGGLHELSITGYIGNNLLGRGHGSNFNFSPSLTNLYLNDGCLTEDPMPILEKFPNLRIISLNKAYSGKEMICSAMGFPQLRWLKLKGLCNLEKWTIEKGAMPNLLHLTIDGCDELEKWTIEKGAMPNLLHLTIAGCDELEKLPELMFVTTLRELKISCMTEIFKARIRVIDGKQGADFHKIQHVPSILIKDNNFSSFKNI